MTTHYDPNRTLARAELRAKGSSEADVLNYEDEQVRAAAPSERHADAAVHVAPVVQAVSLDRRFFTTLAPELRALVTLWSLSVQIRRNGLLSFIEEVPPWVVDDVPSAARGIGEPALATAFERLLPKLQRGRSSRYSSKRLDFSEHEEIERILTRREEGRGFEDGLVDRVLAHDSAFEALRPRALALLETRQAASQRKLEAKQAPARAGWDALRETARPWNASMRFESDEGLLHPKFGLGRVRTTAETKITVEFEDGTTRALAHAR